MIYPENAVVFAPLSGYTDLPCRNSARRFGCYYAFTEMIDAGSLVFGNWKTIKFLDRGKNEPWLGVQLVGSDPDVLGKAVEILNQHHFDVLDFNLGCPAPKVAKKGEGAALALNLDKAIKAFEAISKNSKIPVSSKIRVLDFDDPTPTIELASRLVECGAQTITIHGRIAKAFYSGPVATDVIAAVAQEISVPVIANGGAMDKTSACELSEKSSCSRIMIARGAMGNPWIFKAIISPDEFVPPSAHELAMEMRRHILDMVDCYGEELALRISRKTILAYIRGRGFPGALKAGVSTMATVEHFLEFCEKIAEGPSPRYWIWLKGNPMAERRLRSSGDDE